MSLRNDCPDPRPVHRLPRGRWSPVRLSVVDTIATNTSRPDEPECHVKSRLGLQHPTVILRCPGARNSIKNASPLITRPIGRFSLVAPGVLNQLWFSFAKGFSARTGPLGAQLASARVTSNFQRCRLFRRCKDGRTFRSCGGQSLY